MSREDVDRRVLGAVRFVDAVTGLEIGESLKVAATGVRWMWNRRGWGVIADAPGLHHHTEVWETPPTDVALGSVPVVLHVTDPGGTYLARRTTIALPRDPDPAKATQPESLFRPVDVRMFRSPAAAVSAAWAVIRATVTAEGTGQRLGGVLVRVLRPGATPALMARGITDHRGEALVAVPGVPVTTFGTGAAVVATAVTVTLQAIVEVGAAEPPDPDDLEDKVGTPGIKSVTVTDVSLVSGRTVVQPIVVAL